MDNFYVIDFIILVYLIVCGIDFFELLSGNPNIIIVAIWFNYKIFIHILLLNLLRNQ